MYFNVKKADVPSEFSNVNNSSSVGFFNSNFPKNCSTFVLVFLLIAVNLIYA